MKVDTSSIEKILSKARKVALTGHFNPDGDSVGSVVGMHHYLSARGIDSTMILPSEFPASLGFLNPAGKDGQITVYKENPDKALKAISEADVIICLDFNRFSRTEFLEDALRESHAKKILIDHHLSPEKDEFDVVISKTDISSACELLFWTLMDMPDIAGDPGRLSMPCVNALYVGMMTDTNNFSNSCFPSTFMMASLLLERGVDKTRLQEKVLQCYTIPRTRLMGHLLKDKIIYYKDLHATCMTLSNKEKKAHRFEPGDSEGFVNLPLAVKSVKISALFTENGDGQYIRVSLRSKGKTDVNGLARRFFNGGGHKNAAGGRLYMHLEDVPAYYEKSLREYFSIQKNQNLF